MANKPPAFLFYVADFLAGVKTFEPDDIGIYVMLLCYQWDYGSIPNDPDKLAKYCQTTPENFKRIWGNVKDKFEPNGDNDFTNNRMEKERTKQEENREKRMNAGIVGAHARWHDSKRNADAMRNDGFLITNSNSKKDTNSLHAPRPEAKTAEEIEKLDFVLRLHDDEFKTWMQSILMLIGEENKLRPHNQFVWKPTCGSVASDLKGLIYKISDDRKKSVLYDAYNILGDKMNWPEYVKKGIMVMLKASNKKPIHAPYKFVWDLLGRPGDIVSEASDGSLAKILTGGTP